MLHFLRVTGFLPLTYKVSLFVLSTNSHYAPTMAVLDAVDPVVNRQDHCTHRTHILVGETDDKQVMNE